MPQVIGVARIFAVGGGGLHSNVASNNEIVTTLLVIVLFFNVLYWTPINVAPRNPTKIEFLPSGGAPYKLYPLP